MQRNTNSLQIYFNNWGFTIPIQQYHRPVPELPLGPSRSIQSIPAPT